MTKLPRTRSGACSPTSRTGESFPTCIPICAGKAHHWAVGSALVGQLNYPIVVSGRYVIGCWGLCV